MLLGVGCSPKNDPAQDGPKGQVVAVKTSPTPKAKDVVKSPTKSEAKIARSEAEQVANFRTMFRAVLGGGYSVRSAKVTDKYLAYCRSSYAKLIKEPQVVRPFLEKKLREGRINERPLAIHLLAALGKEAQPSARHIAGVAVRSWDVAYNRCLAKAKGTPLSGRAPEATKEERQRCTQSLGGSRAPSSLRMACSALRKIGDKANVARILKTGMSGYFANPCALYIVENDLESPEALRFVAEEIDGKPNGSALWSGLLSRGADGVAAVLKILEARARSKKIYNEPLCLSARFIQAYRAGGGSLDALSEETRTRLTGLASGQLGNDFEVPESIRKCARQSMNALKASAPDRPRKVRTPKVELGTAPFCPEKRAGSKKAR